MRIHDGIDLAYCTNIHPGETWEEVSRNLAADALVLKRRLSPDRPFALGLRLSDRAARQLLESGRLAQFAAFQAEHGLYTRLLNGYPYGAFHGTAVKAAVFAPDWRCEERAQYTLRLVRVLEGLLSRDDEGGISTLPLSYKAWMHPEDRGAWVEIVRNLVSVAARLIRLRREKGIRLRLEIEPEPGGLIENCQEVVAFFHDWLLPRGSAELATALGMPEDEAWETLLEHVCVCYDTCHFAVEYEEPETVLSRFQAAGILIGRAQLSSALVAPIPSEEAASRLRVFADSTYLHQVIERSSGGSVRAFPDLPEALASTPACGPGEWRVHYHVPLFASEYGPLRSSQEYIRKVLSMLSKTAFTRHLEIETYTWDVLPDQLKLDLDDSIEREYRWVLEQLCARRQS